MFSIHYNRWVIKENIQKILAYAGKKRTAWNEPTKPFPNKWNRKLAKSN